jgi:uncharacterized protein YacL
MLLHILRVFFAVMIIMIGLGYADAARQDIDPMTIFLGGVALAAGVVLADVFVPRKSLAAIAGVFFGLVVGMLITYGVSLVLNIFAEVYPRLLKEPSLLSTIKLMLGVILCYLCVSFILQTQDDIRFVIPYVEFAKQIKGQHPLILDTSVIIDGRIADICETRIVDQKLIVPRFVLQELQTVADSSDKLKRNRGRRGLDVLNRMQGSSIIDIEIFEGGLTAQEQTEPVDQKLLILAKHINGRVVTNDYNLNKVAQLRGVEIININDLANALKPVVLPGERLEVKILRPGQEFGQGVGYLDDGTMVVIEGGRERIGDTVAVHVTSALQTSAGRMVFGRMDDAHGPGRGHG